MQLGYFPLPVFLLPGGITKLRVFEQRYIRLVQEAAGDTGFAITCPLMTFEPACEEYNWGSWVKIVDFATGDDGLLHIDVQCVEMVKLKDLSIEPDGLKRGNVEIYHHWAEDNESQAKHDEIDLSRSLKHLFEEHTFLQDLYKTPDFDSQAWVVSRWLEIIPLLDEDKNRFVHPCSFEQAKDFVIDILKK